MYLNKNDHIIFLNITAILKVVLTKAIFLIIYVYWLNFNEFVIKRRWYNGQHSCLPSSWSGFDSRPTQDPFGIFFLIFLIVWYGSTKNVTLKFWKMFFINILFLDTAKDASAGNRTRINCLEGSYADHYTTDAYIWMTSNISQLDQLQYSGTHR